MSTSDKKYEYIKGGQAKMIFWVGIFLVIIFSFGAGYLIGKQENPTPIIIEKVGQDEVE